MLVFTEAAASSFCGSQSKSYFSPACKYNLERHQFTSALSSRPKLNVSTSNPARNEILKVTEDLF